MLREEKHLTQEQMAKKFNLLKSSISMYENNIRFPNIELIKEFAIFFDVSIDYLLDNVTTSSYENELKEKEVLKNLLIKNGYMKEGEDLNDEELQRLIKFVVHNKYFIRKEKNEK